LKQENYNNEHIKCLFSFMETRFNHTFTQFPSSIYSIHLKNINRFYFFLGLTTLLSLTSFIQGFGQTTQTYDASGTFTVPAGVTSVSVQAWGAGGGGSNRAGSSGGGGGGAFTAGTFTGLSGNGTITITVGTGGTVGLPTTAPGNYSQAVSGANTIRANGGLSRNNNRTGGPGGTAIAVGGIITASYAGGAGGTAPSNGGGSNENGGGGGGSAYTNAVGANGTGGQNSNTIPSPGGAGTGNGGQGGCADGNPDATAGSAPGGGGGGRGEGGGTSKAGANGRVNITYTCPTYSLTGTSATNACAATGTSTVTLTSSVAGLPTGTYTVTYSTSSPAQTGLTASMTVSTAGSGTFTATGLTTAGSSILTVSDLGSGSGNGVDPLCSSTISSNNTATITVNDVPAQPSSISGSTTPCQGSSQNYSVTNVSGVTYNWSFPSGWTQTGGGTTNSVTVTVGATSGNVQVTPSNSCGSGTAQTLAVSVSTLPSITSTSPGSRCGPGDVTVSATASSGTINWYTSSSGGSSIGTGNSYLATGLSSNTTFYVSATNGCGTSTPRTAVTAYIITPPDITADGEGTFCTGDNVNLSSSGSTSNLYWTGPNSYYSTTQNPTLSSVTSSMTGYYVVNSNALSGVNLVTNGDFESGITGFTSSYAISDHSATGLYPEGVYDVIAHPSSQHANFCYCGDHTSGAGLQMAINGAGTADEIIWSQTVNVVPNTYYQFSYWLQTIVNPTDVAPSELQLYVNGSASGPIYTANATAGVWTQFMYNWSSGSNTTAVLSLVNQNTALNGNDFALDDIIFQHTCVDADSVLVTVNDAVTAGAIGSNQTICSGQTPASLTSATDGTGPGTLNYEWQTNASGSYVTIPGATTSTYSPPALTSTTSYRRRTVSFHNSIYCYSAYTTAVTITVSAASTAEASGPETVCESASPATITLSGASTTGGTGYTWSILSLVPSNGGTDGTLTQGTTPATGTYTPPANYSGVVTLRLAVTGSACNAQDDRIITITPLPVAPTSATSDRDNFCADDAGNIDLSVNGGSGTTVRWFTGSCGGTDIGTGNPLTIASPITSTTYYARWETSCGNSTCADVNVTVYNNFDAGEITTTGQTICYDGDPSVIGSSTDASGGDNTITYQWQYSTDVGWSSPQTIAVSNSSTYNPPANLTENRWYRRQAHDGTCNTSFTTSTGVWAVTVRPNFTAGEIATTGQTICYNGDPSVIGSSTDASGGDNTITYQWQYSTDAGFSSPVDISSNTATYDPPANLTQNRWYRRQAHDGTCNTSFTTSTGVWAVTVRPNFTAGEIATTGQTICYNGDPSVIGSSTDASGGDNTITYQWQYSTDAGFSSPVDISSNTATYDPPANLTQNRWYRRQAHDGTCNTSFTTSTGVWAVTVRPNFTAGEIATTGQTICYNGDPSVIGSTTDASGGDNTITYQWQYSTDAGFSSPVDISSNSATYDPPANLTQSRWYRRQAHDGTCNTSFTTSTGIWAVTVRPNFTAGEIASTGQTICYNGDPSVIGSTTDASGGDNSITYQWQYSTDAAWTSPQTIAGSNAATYNPPANLNENRWYRRQAHDGTCNTSFTTSTGVWAVDLYPRPTATPTLVGTYGICPETNHPPFNADNNGPPNPGTTYVDFNITRTGGVGDWEFDFVIHVIIESVDHPEFVRDTIVTLPAYIDSGSDWTVVCGDNDNINLRFEIVNDPGHEITVALLFEEIRNETYDGSPCGIPSFTTVNVEQVIYAMPAVGPFD
jgi:hypothetical protein